MAASELPFRLLARKYGAQLCYTPMLHSGVLTNAPKRARTAFYTCKEDEPLIVQVEYRGQHGVTSCTLTTTFWSVCVRPSQLCGDDPTTVLTAAKLVQDRCMAVDLNLGCPQKIAKRGHYGAFLLEGMLRDTRVAVHFLYIGHSLCAATDSLPTNQPTTVLPCTRA